MWPKTLVDGLRIYWTSPYLRLKVNSFPITVDRRDKSGVAKLRPWSVSADCGVRTACRYDDWLIFDI